MRGAGVASYYGAHVLHAVVATSRHGVHGNNNEHDDEHMAVLYIQHLGWTGRCTDIHLDPCFLSLTWVNLALMKPSE